MSQPAGILHVILFFSFNCLSVYSQKTVRIEGKSKDYAGDTLFFTIENNFITTDESIIAVAAIGSSGEFTAEWKTEKPVYVFFRHGIFKAGLFVEPGISYHIALPEKKEKDTADMLNPYFSEFEVTASILRKTEISTRQILSVKDDLNRLINNYDLLYDSIQTLIAPAIMQGITPRQFDTLTLSLTRYSDTISQPFAAHYFYYRICQLRFKALKMSPSHGWHDFFAAKPISVDHPAWQSMFLNCFNRCFNVFSTGKKGHLFESIIQNDTSISKLREFVSEAIFSKNDTLVDLAIIKGIFDAFYSTGFDKHKLLLLLDSVSVTTTGENIKKIAITIKNDLARLMPGMPAPWFNLTDCQGKSITPDAFYGRYIYLNFCNSINYTCLKEYNILADYHQRFGKQLQIITIFTGESYERMKSFAGNNKYNWLFVHAGINPKIHIDYKVKALPCYFLIGPDGKLLLSPAPSPDERFEIYFFSLLRDAGMMYKDNSGFNLLK